MSKPRFIVNAAADTLFSMGEIGNYKTRTANLCNYRIVYLPGIGGMHYAFIHSIVFVASICYCFAYACFIYIFGFVIKPHGYESLRHTALFSKRLNFTP